MKPKVFIGSSREGLPVAEAIQAALAHDAEPSLWSDGIFRVIYTPLENLTSALNSFDFAVFVLLPEDHITARSVATVSVRDNVIFELGLFLGRLGRERIFFVEPKNVGIGDFHLPSDFSGITPAVYDPDADNIDASVGTALRQLKQSIRKLGTLGKQVFIYDGAKQFKPYHFIHRNGYFYENRRRVGSPSSGNLVFEAEDTIKLERANLEGRYEIELRENGKASPSIRKRHEPIHRVIRVDCEARVEGGERIVRFVLKDIKADQWAADETKTVKSQEWQRLTMYFLVLPTVDLLFRIDDERPSRVPSTLYLRKLQISEEA